MYHAQSLVASCLLRHVATCCAGEHGAWWCVVVRSGGPGGGSARYAERDACVCGCGCEWVRSGGTVRFDVLHLDNLAESKLKLHQQVQTQECN